MAKIITKIEDYVIIKNIIYNDLILPELFQYTTMTTDSDNPCIKIDKCKLR